MPFDGYVLGQPFFHKFACADFAWFFEQQPSIFFEPIFASSRNMIVTILRMASSLERFILRDGGRDYRQIVLTGVSTYNNQELISCSTIPKLESFPVENATGSDGISAHVVSLSSSCLYSNFSRSIVGTSCTNGSASRPSSGGIIDPTPFPSL